MDDVSTSSYCTEIKIMFSFYHGSSELSTVFTEDQDWSKDYFH